MKSQVCCRPLLPSKKIHISYALPYGHEKREIDFFIVASTLVATKWLLMLGNFETLGSKFRHETAGLLLSFTTISKNPHLIRTPIKSRKKRNRFFIVVNTLVATKWLLMLGKFETLGSKFSHETAGLLPSFATISKKSTSHTHPHTVTKKEKSIFYSSKHISSHQMATNARKL